MFDLGELSSTPGFHVNFGHFLPNCRVFFYFSSDFISYNQYINHLFHIRPSHQIFQRFMTSRNNFSQMFFSFDLALQFFALIRNDAVNDALRDDHSVLHNQDEQKSNAEIFPVFLTGLIITSFILISVDLRLPVPVVVARSVIFNRIRFPKIEKVKSKFMLI